MPVGVEIEIVVVEIVGISELGRTPLFATFGTRIHFVQNFGSHMDGVKDFDIE